jgi:hypothetical protein
MTRNEYNRAKVRKRLARLEQLRQELYDEPHPYRTLMDLLALLIADEKDQS